ncbi:MAG: HlyD family type I secretion periplasmic adaptor subunit [Hyphomicrobiales bacterium]|uniref:HlyD family type I secretion periplasmic adaptor subunit n=1 Tax=Rhabdaerophilum calidifontis TaxID=2604328 RepID=UPI00123A4553|nr:HlyD family type I secretion periplasmic adaptor subunit [Rhabdaerophilum calidifontis]MCA1951460.1 HlyD family type I secretion periplasmic adaptor subunit [Hyphomicrobiales bacterium]MCA1998233.1 HlyD family type I secretion periplasmic adaptor subunit [Hyphomicrobiales bacterium]
MASTDNPTLDQTHVPVPSTDWRGMLRIGNMVAFGGFGTFLLWASIARLDGAAIAAGVVSTETNRKTIQHLEGGIVQEILVRDGMRVTANQVLIRLDPTRLDTQGDLYANQLAILQAQEARLLAEFELKEQLELPPEVLRRASEPSVAPVIADQKRLFESRRAAVLRNSGIAEAQIEQTRKEIEQAKSDIATARATLDQVNAELEALMPLFRRQLVPTTRIAPLEREKLRLTGIINNGEIQTTRLQDKLNEFLLRLQQVLQDYKQEASAQLVDIRKQLSDVRQQLLLTADLQRRSEIRAPIAGVVQQLRIFTVGGVIRPGDPILDLVPENDDLVIRAKVSPNDADRVATGLNAEIRFPGFSYWGSQVIRGTVTAMSRDRIVENGGKDVYFAADVTVNKETVPKEISERLSAGLSADIVITTGERTVMSYLLKPITERFWTSMRER